MKSKHQNPGPGSYNNKSTLDVPSVKIGTEKKGLAEK